MYVDVEIPLIILYNIVYCVYNIVYQICKHYFLKKLSLYNVVYQTFKTLLRKNSGLCE